MEILGKFFSADKAYANLSLDIYDFVRMDAALRPKLMVGFMRLCIAISAILNCAALRLLGNFPRSFIHGH